MESYLEAALPGSQSVCIMFHQALSLSRLCAGVSAHSVPRMQSGYEVIGTTHIKSREIAMKKRLLWCHWYKSFCWIWNFTVLHLIKNELASKQTTGPKSRMPVTNRISCAIALFTWRLVWLFYSFGSLQPKIEPLDVCKSSFLGEKYIVVADHKQSLQNILEDRKYSLSLFHFSFCAQM